MNIFKEAGNKENKTLSIIFGITALGILIAATYLTFTFHSFANRINSEIASFVNDKDAYLPVPTILFLALPPLLLLLLLKIIIVRFLLRKKG